MRNYQLSNNDTKNKLKCNVTGNCKLNKLLVYNNSDKVPYSCIAQYGLLNAFAIVMQCLLSK